MRNTSRWGAKVLHEFQSKQIYRISSRLVSSLISLPPIEIDIEIRKCERCEANKRPKTIGKTERERKIKGKGKVGKQSWPKTRVKSSDQPVRLKLFNWIFSTHLYTYYQSDLLSLSLALHESHVILRGLFLGHISLCGNKVKFFNCWLTETTQTDQSFDSPHR